MKACHFRGFPGIGAGDEKLAGGGNALMQQIVQNGGSGGLAKYPRLTMSFVMLIAGFIFGVVSFRFCEKTV